MTAWAEGPGVISWGMSSGPEQGDEELRDEGTPFPRLTPAPVPCVWPMSCAPSSEVNTHLSGEQSLVSFYFCPALPKLTVDAVFSYHHTVLGDALQKADRYTQGDHTATPRSCHPLLSRSPGFRVHVRRSSHWEAWPGRVM